MRRSSNLLRNPRSSRDQLNTQEARPQPSNGPNDDRSPSRLTRHKAAACSNRNVAHSNAHLRVLRSAASCGFSGAALRWTPRRRLRTRFVPMGAFRSLQCQPTTAPLCAIGPVITARFLYLCRCCLQVRRLQSSVQDLQNALRLACRMDAAVRPTKGDIASLPIEPSASPYAHILANNDRGVLHGIEVLHGVTARMLSIALPILTLPEHSDCKTLASRSSGSTASGRSRPRPSPDSKYTMACVFALD